MNEEVYSTQGAATHFHLPKKFSDIKTWIVWCKTTWGTTFAKGILPLVGEPRHSEPEVQLDGFEMNMGNDYYPSLVSHMG